jgi:hypothetical protein
MDLVMKTNGAGVKEQGTSLLRVHTGPGTVCVPINWVKTPVNMFTIDRVLGKLEWMVESIVGINHVNKDALD